MTIWDGMNLGLGILIDIFVVIAVLSLLGVVSAKFKINDK